jgi:hypothetical protein
MSRCFMKTLLEAPAAHGFLAYRFNAARPAHVPSGPLPASFPAGTSSLALEIEHETTVNPDRHVGTTNWTPSFFTRGAHQESSVPHSAARALPPLLERRPRSARSIGGD